jgi:uroporphyrinogen-III decarboxylase
LLIEEGADIDTADQHGSTALIQAVNNGNIEIAELLIEEDADVIAVDSYGYNAHDYVKFSQKPVRKIFKAADHERRESLLKLLMVNSAVLVPPIGLLYFYYVNFCNAHIHLCIGARRC